MSQNKIRDYSNYYISIRTSSPQPLLLHNHQIEGCDYNIPLNMSYLCILCPCTYIYASAYIGPLFPPNIFIQCFLVRETGKGENKEKNDRREICCLDRPTHTHTDAIRSYGKKM